MPDNPTLPKGTKVYLASRYSRRDELMEYASHLEVAKVIVTSRWILGNHQISDDGLSEDAKEDERTRFAVEDWHDLMAADVCISFTEPPRSANSRGGRHVEFGAAVAAGKRVLVVGYRENVFHCLPKVEFYPNWIEAFEGLMYRKRSCPYAGCADPFNNRPPCSLCYE